MIVENRLSGLEHRFGRNWRCGSFTSFRSLPLFLFFRLKFGRRNPLGSRSYRSGLLAFSNWRRSVLLFNFLVFFDLEQVISREHTVADPLFNLTCALGHERKVEVRLGTSRLLQHR